MDHTPRNCRFQSNDIIKGKLKDKTNVANVSIVEDPPDANNGDDLIE
jgi:hypothetical protein